MLRRDTISIATIRKDSYAPEWLRSATTEDSKRSLSILLRPAHDCELLSLGYLSIVMKLFAAALLQLLLVARTDACSDFVLNTTDAHAGVLSGRTMDFAADLASVVEVVPRGTVFQELPVRDCADCPDYKWTSTFGFVALNMFGLNVAADGMNEKGLSAAELYLVATQYPVPTTLAPSQRSNNNSSTRDATKPIVTSLCSYILGNFATVDDVRQGFEKIQIAEFDERLATMLVGKRADLGRVPLHISVHDASGQSLVVEFLNGTVTLHDNSRNQVLTNDPPFKEQLAALEANGWTNLPGGYGSTERFVRLSVLNRHVPFGYVDAPPNATYLAGTAEQRAVADTLHLLNTVVRPPSSEATEWSIVRDHSRKKLYVRSNVNQVLRQIDLNALRFDDMASRRAVPVTHGNWFVDMTRPLLDEANTLRTVDLPARSQIEALLQSHAPSVVATSPSPSPSVASASSSASSIATPSTAPAVMQTTATATAAGAHSTSAAFWLGCLCGTLVTSLAAVAGPIVLQRVRQRGYEPIRDASTV